MNSRPGVGLPAILFLLSLAGLAIGAYLTVAHWGDQPIACGGVGDCGYVNSSDYATIGGIPVSALGAMLYAAMAFVSLRWIRHPYEDRLAIIYWALALSGTVYAGYLTYVELAILSAICIWCVTSALLLTLSLALSSWAVLGGGRADD